jgi:hypothetical protein
MLRQAEMHFRRFACFLLGAWLAGGLFMALVATENFRSVDRLLAKPAAPAAQQLGKLGPAARPLLRYQVSEQNRWYFETWGVVETGIGAALLMVLLFGSTETLFVLLLSLLMLLIALVQRFVLTPEIVVLGRVIDFVPAGLRSPERSRFWTLHGMYSGLEVLKWILGLVLAARLIFRKRHSDKGDPDLEMLERRGRAGS